MKKILCLLIVFIPMFIIGMSSAYAQGGIGINPSGNPADNSAMIDVSSTTKGTLITRMTTAQRDAISNPATGLMIFNTDCNTLNFNTGTPSTPIWASVNTTSTLVAGVSISSSPTGAICSGASITFTAAPANGITSPSYQWKVNGGDVGTNNATYSSATLNNGDVVSCVLTSNEPCVIGSPATSNTMTMLVNTSPTITGTTDASTCGAGPITVGATASGGIINWYAASTGGASLGSGTTFTTSISSTTTFYADATANGCTTPTRTAVTATVYSSTPAQPGTITSSVATTNLGGQTGVIYFISPVSLATTYNWSVPGGATIAGGQGTTSLIVNFGCSATGSVTVVAANACGSSPAQSLSVSTSLPTPGTISGQATYLGGLSGIAYSISTVANATSYTWSVPSGATITGGQGTTDITVDFGCSSSGNISVVQNSACGTSSPRTLSVSSVLQVPGSITGPVTVSKSATATYSINSVPNANSYTWTVVLGTITAGQGSTSINVTWSSSSGIGSVSVVQNISTCTSSDQTISVNVGTQIFSATGSGRIGTIQSFTVPPVGIVVIEAWGAEGGKGNAPVVGGKGAYMKGTFNLTPGNVLSIVVGQKGLDYISGNASGGGGGGSFVYLNSSTPLLIAGGGGGAGGFWTVNGTAGMDAVTSQNATASRNGQHAGGTGGNGGMGACVVGGTNCNGLNGGAGGGGWLTAGGNDQGNGAMGGSAMGGNGGAHGDTGGDGGFGGGGGARNVAGGGGGGYSGGGGGDYPAGGVSGSPGGGGGGGSYCSGTLNASSAGVQSGNGQVIISW